MDSELFLVRRAREKPATARFCRVVFLLLAFRFTRLLRSVELYGAFTSACVCVPAFFSRVVKQTIAALLQLQQANLALSPSVMLSLSYFGLWS